MKKKAVVLPYSDPNLPVPPIRYDVNLIPVKHQGEDLVIFHDPLQYAAPDIALAANVTQFFPLFDGRSSLDEVYKRYFRKSTISLSNLTGLITHLDGSRLLHSTFFRNYVNEAESKFENSDARPATCMDSCYPSDAGELRQWFDEAFNGYSGSENALKALYAPHIDYRVGIKTYSKAFSRLRGQKPKRVVIIGTSHYAGYYGALYENRPFIISGKDIHTPFGTLKADKELIKQAKTLDGESYGISMNDRAHRVEHSIELHAVMSQYVWGNDVTVLSVLVGSMEEFIRLPVGNQGRQIKKMASWLRSLDDGNTVFLISGDQAHVGKKFGDSKSAKEMIDDVKSFDETYLEFAADAEVLALLSYMQQTEDAYRICGFPPLMLYLCAFPESKGELIDYNYWDEHERESGVTFAAIGYK